MIYITTRQKSKERQISWLDLINDENDTINMFSEPGTPGTITRVYETVPEKFMKKINTEQMIQTLKKFNAFHEDLFSKDRKSLYRHFAIPKKQGGLRQIDAPNDELQNALEELKIILADKFGVLHHTSAFAYVTGRCTVQEVRKHQVNESNWFYGTDCSGFFPNTTLDFTMKMLEMVFPLSEICKTEDGKNELRKALSLGFLNSGLPQGTKLSPYLTNVIMIPIDHRLFNELAHRRFVYTRYADDMHISCVQKFSKEKMTAYIEKVFREFGAPWILKPEKTTFGSRKGRNYMLGVCLNAQNNITVGYRAKATFKAMTSSLILDYKHGHYWPLEDVQHYRGLLSYYEMVEKDYFSNLIKHFDEKYNCDTKTILKRLFSLSVPTAEEAAQQEGYIELPWS